MPKHSSATLTNYEAVNHAATFTFEWLFMSIFKSVPGYALEKFLNHGSREL
jgi:hypothetical protein